MAETCVSVVKVEAHQTPEATAMLPSTERLLAHGNQAADLAAKKGVLGHAGLKEWLGNNAVYLQL
eukprot:3816967-Prorocentrum_lima.AAC.1